MALHSNRLLSIIQFSVEPRLNRLNVVPRDWGNLFVILLRVCYIKHVDLTNFRKKKQPKCLLYRGVISNSFTKPSISGSEQITAITFVRLGNICKAAPIFLFWVPNYWKWFSKFPSSLITKLTMAFLTGQSWHILKSWYTGRDPEQGFQHCLTEGLNQKLRSVYP